MFKRNKQFKSLQTGANDRSSITLFPIMLVLDDIVIIYIECIVTICDL